MTKLVRSSTYIITRLEYIKRKEPLSRSEKCGSCGCRPFWSVFRLLSDCVERNAARTLDASGADENVHTIKLVGARRRRGPEVVADRAVPARGGPAPTSRRRRTDNRRARTERGQPDDSIPEQEHDERQNGDNPNHIHVKDLCNYRLSLDRNMYYTRLAFKVKPRWGEIVTGVLPGKKERPYVLDPEVEVIDVARSPNFLELRALRLFHRTMVSDAGDEDAEDRDEEEEDAGQHVMRLTEDETPDQKDAKQIPEVVGVLPQLESESDEPDPHSPREREEDESAADSSRDADVVSRQKVGDRDIRENRHEKNLDVTLA